VNDSAVEGEFVVGSPLGLHARPAGRFVSLAGRFRSEVQVTREPDGWVSGRSVLSLLSLAAAQGTKLRIRAVGEDAQAAVAALGQLIESREEEASA
jgi:phosphotransferase system HPr (HPr) family protein